MEAIRLSEFVTDKGIYISKELVKKFQNMQVEIIILPLDEKKAEKDFMKFAGKLSETEGSNMLKAVDECRKIDEAGW